MVCESLVMCIQMVLNHHRYSITNDQMPHFQGIIKNDNSMTDGKLLSNDKMPLMANQPLSASISNINITCSMSLRIDYSTIKNKIMLTS